jgi:hypothetical protein
MEIRRDQSAMVARWGAPQSKEEIYFLRLAGDRQDDFTTSAGPAPDLVLMNFWADAYYTLCEHGGLRQTVPFSPTALGHQDVLAELDEDDLKARNVTPEALLCYHYLKAVAKCVGLSDEAGFKQNVVRIIFSPTGPMPRPLSVSCAIATRSSIPARNPTRFISPAS